MERQEIIKDLNLRVSSIKGHLDKVEEMLNDGRVECCKILEQTHAISGALRSLDKTIILNHYKNCLWEQGERSERHDKVVEELVNCLDRRIN